MYLGLGTETRLDCVRITVGVPLEFKFVTEDIRDATHTPKREGRHLSLTFDTVLGGNVHQRHICNKCVADGLYA